MSDPIIPALAAVLADHHKWITGFSWCLLCMALIQNLVYILQLPAAWLELRKHSQSEDTESSWQLLISDVAPSISVLMPAYNEAAVIVPAVRSMLGLTYPNVEVIVINDGSKDATLQVLIEAFSLTPVFRAHELAVPHAPVKTLYGSPLYPRLLVLDKEAGGSKADASNAGINFARSPIFCVVDADCLLEGEALLRVIRPFMEEPERMVGVGGTIRIINGCITQDGHVVCVRLPSRFLPLVQSLEYIRAFLMARLAFSRWGVLTIISGAFGIFRRDIAVAAGGFTRESIGEDLELVLKTHRLMRDRKQPYQMRYVPESVCWTEAPETLAMLGNQRKRWQRGALDAFFRHKDMLFNPRYGRIGFFGFGYSLIVDVLGPLMEALGYILIPIFYLAGILNLNFMLAYLALMLMFGVFISVASLILEEVELSRVPTAHDLLVLASVAVLENFGYRQLNSFWRVVGWWEFLRKKKGWGAMTRTGFLTSETP